jgi:class 3 adenylate cyclase
VSERLLLNVLPHSIAERLAARPAVSAESSTELIDESFAEVAVLFSDIVEFTKFSEGVSAEVLKGVLDDISAGFDGITGKRSLNRSETIGDTYLAVAGLSDPLANRAIRASRMALDLIEAVDRFNGHSRYKLKLRIGFDTFPAKDGGAGKRKMIFDL